MGRLCLRFIPPITFEMPLKKRKQAALTREDNKRREREARARAAAEKLVDLAEDDEVLPDAPGMIRTRALPKHAI